MKKLIIFAIAALLVLVVGCSKGDQEKAQKEIPAPQGERPRVVLETDIGKIVLELFPDVAPNHVRNFLSLVNDGFYNGLIFHRVVKNFVIQSGSPDGTPGGHAGFTIPAELSKLRHLPGTLGMARGDDPNSASSQFYICLNQLPDLDGRYTIFGQTLEGMETVQKIGAVETDPQERPLQPVKIIRAWEEGRLPAETKSVTADTAGG